MLLNVENERRFLPIPQQLFVAYVRAIHQKAHGDRKIPLYSSLRTRDLYFREIG